jgi:hypothetical protein
MLNEFVPTEERMYLSFAVMVSLTIDAYFSFIADVLRAQAPPAAVSVMKLARSCPLWGTSIV